VAFAIHEIFTSESAALAPLAGVTDSVFRRICAGFGASPVMTEMVSSEGYVRGHPSDKTSRLLRFHESERPIGFQFFGACPEVMAAAARKAQELNPDFIDINAGCPVRKVVGRGAGSALLQKPDLLADIVKQVVNVSSVPVTVKIRSGWDQSTVNAVEVARRCVDAGAQAVIIHPRTRSQGFGGTADWSLIRQVRENVAVPVVGSGDIKTSDDVLRMKEETGVEHVMVGRATLGNPWIFREIRERLRGYPLSKKPDNIEKMELALKQLELLAKEVSELYAVLNMRKFFGWYSKGIRDGALFRQSVFRCETIDEVRNTVRAFQDECRKRECSDDPFDSMSIEMVEQ
jgi:tRNA-dihydrouridine synthase B